MTAKIAEAREYRVGVQRLVTAATPSALDDLVHRELCTEAVLEGLEAVVEAMHLLREEISELRRGVTAP